MKQLIKIASLKQCLALCAVLLCSLCWVTDATAAPAKSKPNAQSLDRIVAIVNDIVITQSELDEALKAAKKQLEASNIAIPPANLLHKQVLDQLINRKLQLYVAEQAGMKVTDEQVNKVIADIAQKNKLSVKDLYVQVVHSGLDVKEYQKEIREELTIQQVQQQEVGGHIVVTPQQVDDFMRSADWQAFNNKEYHLEDILIALPENPTPQDVATAKKKAEDVLAQIHKGTSFKEAATEESGSSGALQGGDLGWRQLPQIPSAFADQLVHMKQNDILGPVQTPNGFHLVKLTGLRSVGQPKDNNVERKQVEQLLYQRKFEEEVQTWITKVRSAAFINLHPEG
ncbi:MAG: peptidylprolyl isomerase [Gammaproteobacteria bacterium]|nr:peptidylprolyl isomerase [Gammaproteobacteria bacterium]